MRCRQVRQRLTACRGDKSKLDDAVREHLKDCRDCALAARSELLLAQDFHRLSEDDTEGGSELSHLRTRVDAVSCPDRERIMSKITRQIRRRPKLVAVSTVALMLLLTTLIPIKMNETIGYEVAFAGVQKDLALDEFKIQEFLTAIGVDKASFEVGDCEQTCNLKIGDLHSEQDVQLVLTAFNELGDVELKDVYEVKGEEEGSILAHVKNVFFGGGELISTDDQHLQELVVQCIDSLHVIHDGQFNLYFSPDDSGCCEGNAYIGSNVSLEDSDLDAACSKILIKKGCDGTATWTVTDSDIAKVLAEAELNVQFGDKSQFVQQKALLETSDGKHIVAGHCNLETVDGEQYWRGTDKNGNTYRINVDAPDFWEQLVATGDPNIDFDASGMTPEEIDTAEKPGEALPDGFELDQNYPNPFNPTTTIHYALPESEHVHLDIINMKGQVVRTLVDNVVSAGEHSAFWDSKDADGSQVASGIYVYRLTAGEASISKKMTLLK